MADILFIGNIQWGQNSTGGGVQTKNQHFLRYIKSRGVQCKFYDTWGKHSIVSLLMSMFYIIMAKRDEPIILSISSRGPYYMANICQLLHLKRRVFYWVAGGDFTMFVEKVSPRKREVYKFYEKVVVQCEYMKRDLDILGFTNCEVVPNFKPIIYNPPIVKQYAEITRFVFFSRILQEKGVNEIIEVFKNLRNSNISIDFYGTLQPPYSNDFFKSLKSFNIQYKGFLDMSRQEGYEILSRYDVLLFPTYFEGEGFPGTLLDSFIAGVPVIATDFHANSEIIKDGVNGILIPPKDVDSLSKAIVKLASNSELRKQIRGNAILSAKRYEMEYVLDKAFKELGIYKLNHLKYEPYKISEKKN